MAAEWYCKNETEQLGPLTTAELVRRACNQQLQPGDQVRVGKSGPWIRAETVKGLFSQETIESQLPAASDPVERESSTVSQPPVARRHLRGSNRTTAHSSGRHSSERLAESREPCPGPHASPANGDHSDARRHAETVKPTGASPNPVDSSEGDGALGAPVPSSDSQRLPPELASAPGVDRNDQVADKGNPSARRPAFREPPASDDRSAASPRQADKRRRTSRRSLVLLAVLLVSVGLGGVLTLLLTDKSGSADGGAVRPLASLAQMRHGRTPQVLLSRVFRWNNAAEKQAGIRDVVSLRVDRAWTTDQLPDGFELAKPSPGPRQEDSIFVVVELLVKNISDATPIEVANWSPHIKTGRSYHVAMMTASGKACPSVRKRTVRRRTLQARESLRELLVFEFPLNEHAMDFHLALSFDPVGYVGEIGFRLPRDWVEWEPLPEIRSTNSIRK